MPITLVTQPITATAQLNADEVTSLETALLPLLTSLPSGETDLSNATNIDFAKNSIGSGILTIRFSK